MNTLRIYIVGVGGQGNVLASKMIGEAALSMGVPVLMSETHGMAQRGGNVTSHVRMGSNGEAVYSPLITPGTADMVIALEPGEAARALPYLAPGGVLVTATTAIQPVTAALASQPYRAGDVQLWRTPCRRRRPASKRLRWLLRRALRLPSKTRTLPAWKATRCPCSSPWTTRPSCARPVPAPASPST